LPLALGLLLDHGFPIQLGSGLPADGLSVIVALLRDLLMRQRLSALESALFFRVSMDQPWRAAHWPLVWRHFLARQARRNRR
jgi:hypothetical protein